MYVNEQINTDEIPTIETIEFQPISKSYLNFLILIIFFFYGIAITLLISSSFISKFKFESKYLWFSFILISLIVVLFLVVVVYGFSKRKYALRTHDILYTRGLLISKLTTIAYVRIQHIEISSGFIERKLNLATLRIYTAGDSGSDLVIKGLNEIDANNINAFLSEKMNGQF